VCSAVQRCKECFCSVLFCFTTVYTLPRVVSRKGIFNSPHPGLWNTGDVIIVFDMAYNSAGGMHDWGLCEWVCGIKEKGSKCSLLIGLI